MKWYEKFIKPGRIDTYQRGYKVGAARALGLPDNSFCGLSYALWGDFFAAWKANGHGDHLPYDDAYFLTKGR